MHIKETINNIYNSAFKHGEELIPNSHYNIVAIAVVGVALLTFKNSICYPCLIMVPGYLTAKIFITIATKYKLLNIDQLKQKIINLQTKPSYYKILAFIITLIISTIIPPIGLILAFAFGVYLGLTTEFKHYSYRKNIKEFKVAGANLNP